MITQNVTLSNTKEGEIPKQNFNPELALISLSGTGPSSKKNSYLKVARNPSLFCNKNYYYCYVIQVFSTI